MEVTVFNPFVWFLEYANDYTRYCRTVQELNKLDDRELRDIGLARSDIPFVALDAWRAYRLDHV